VIFYCCWPRTDAQLGRYGTIVAKWGLYERGTVKPDFWLFFTFIHSFVRPGEPILSSRPWVPAERARSVKDDAIAPPSGLVLD